MLWVDWFDCIVAIFLLCSISLLVFFCCFVDFGFWFGICGCSVWLFLGDFCLLECFELFAFVVWQLLLLMRVICFVLCGACLVLSWLWVICLGIFCLDC